MTPAPQDWKNNNWWDDDTQYDFTSQLEEALSKIRKEEMLVCDVYRAMNADAEKYDPTLDELVSDLGFNEKLNDEQRAAIKAVVNSGKFADPASAAMNESPDCNMQ